MHTVICYDIVDDRTRNRFANFLLDYAVRVQHSVFECHENAVTVSKIIDEATRVIDPNSDSVIFYSICGSCGKNEIVIGRRKVSLTDQSYLII